MYDHEVEEDLLDVASHSLWFRARLPVKESSLHALLNDASHTLTFPLNVLSEYLHIQFMKKFHHVLHRKLRLSLVYVSHKKLY